MKYLVLILLVSRCSGGAIHSDPLPYWLLTAACPAKKPEVCERIVNQMCADVEETIRREENGRLELVIKCRRSK